MEVLASKTGYDTEMIEDDMELETELGIDSIKRVEILSEVQSQLGVEAQDVAALSRTRTVGEVIAAMQAEIANASGGAPAAHVSAPAARQQPAYSAAPSSGASAAKATQVVMEVLASKTGYDTEMIEDDMELETELGIDSIKRVEILSEVQSQLGVEAQDVAALSRTRTVGEVIAAMQAEIANASGPGAVLVTPERETKTVDVSGSAVSGDATRVVMEVLASKTGYDTEMIEDDMELETELGIDSIKRVEILSEVQSQLGVEAKNVEALSRTRTVGEVIAAMQEEIRGSSASGIGETAVSQRGSTQSDASRIGVACGVSLTSASLKIIAAPDHARLPEPLNRPVVIVGEGTAFTNETLHSIGDRAVLLSFDPRPRYKRSVVLRDDSAESLRDAVAQIEQTYGTIGGFIHLHRTGVKPAWVLLAAKYVSASLGNPIVGGRTFFMTVCRMDGMLGLGHASGSDIIRSSEPGALFGLVKTLAQEWPQVFCRAIDIDAHVIPVQAARHVVQEVNCPNRCLREVSYHHSGRRYTTCAVSIDTDASDQEFETKRASPAQYSPEDAFLVAGGGRGITPVCMAALARRVGGGTFILLGRSSVTPEPAWARGLTGDSLRKAAMAELKQQYASSGRNAASKPTPRRHKALMKAVTGGRAVRESIATIEQSGGRAIYMACDVTNAEQVRATAQKVAQQGIRITGIVHASGVLRDKRIENKSLSDFNAVYGTKVVGLRNLLACVDLNKLRHVVVFSSLAGFHGNVGQSDYAMANEVLNKAAHAIARKYPACRARALDFGPWDGGMVTPQLKAHFQSQGVEIIPRQEGGDIVAALLTDSTEVQTLVGNWGLAPVRSITNQHTIIRRVDSRTNPFLRSHVIKRKVVLPMTVAVASMGDLALGLYPGYSLQSIEKNKHFAGVFVDQDTRLQITLEEHASMANAPADEAVDTLRLVAKISTIMKQGRVRPNYQSEIVLTKSRRSAPSFQGDLSDEQLNWGKARCYDGSTLFHGPAFQSIEKVLNMSQRRITLRCRDVVQQPGALGQFNAVLDGLNTDTVMQAMLVWARAQRGIASLPNGAKKFEYFSKVPTGRRYYVTLEADGTSTKDQIWQARYHMHGENGVVYGRGVVGVTLNEGLSYA